MSPKSLLPDVVDPAKVAAMRKGLPAVEVVGYAVDVFRVLASPVRLQIVHALAHNEMSVGDLARSMGLSLSVTSHQLALLRQMRLVAARENGRLSFYRATDDFVAHLVHDCLAHVGEKLAPAGKPHHHRHRVSAGRRSRAGSRRA